MSKVVLFATLSVSLALTACDVQVNDQTPAKYPANYDLGLYEIKATVTRDALVSPGSVFMFGVVNNQRIDMTSNRDGTEWHGMYSVRCRNSFPLQLKAIWKLQGLAAHSKVVPEQPREIRLEEPPPTAQASIDTTTKSGKNGYEGSVTYRFATGDARITGAHIEPVSQDPADVAAAKGISVATPLPIDAPCGQQSEVLLDSTAQNAHGNLVIDTDMPAYPHWTTKVDFAPNAAPK